MQHFRRLRPATLFPTFSGHQNVRIQCLYSTETLKRCVIQATKASKTNATVPHRQLYPFRIGECGFHTSQRREIHPLLWVILKPVAKISAALTGRGVRKWYRRMEPKDRKKVLDAVKEKWYLFAGVVGTVVGSFVLYYQSHIEETPITGRKRFVALTHDQILSVAKAQADTLIEAYKDKMCPADSVQARRVMDVAKRLLVANPELQKMSFDKWEVYVIDDPLVNACVFPTGHVFVFDGMLKATLTQDELSIILGHEMAHALLEHAIEELSFTQFIDYIVIVVMAALWCIIPNDGIAIVTQWFHNKMVHILTYLPHSRALEEEADQVGAMLAAKACYDIRHGVVLWQKMEAAQMMASDDTLSLPTFLSTHPHNLKRADYFDFIIPKAEKWRAEGKCPHLPLHDPRAAIQIISKIADEHIIAKKSGQNLKRVQAANIPTAKKVVSTDVDISKVTDAKEQTSNLLIQEVDGGSGIESVDEGENVSKVQTEDARETKALVVGKS